MASQKMNSAQHKFTVIFALVLAISGAVLFLVTTKPDPRATQPSVRIVNGVTVVRKFEAVTTEAQSRPIDPITPKSAVVRQHVAGRLEDVRGTIYDKPKFVDEPVDKKWAGSTEFAIKREILAIPYVDPAKVKVECRATQCIAEGQVVRGISDGSNRYVSDYVSDLKFDTPGPDLNFRVSHATYNEENGGGTIILEFARLRK